MELQQQWNDAASVATTLITTYGLRVIGAIIILVLGWMASRLLYRAVRRILDQSSRIDPTVALFLGNAARYTVMVFTFVAVLTTFGIATTSFVAVLGAMGIAIGLALQGTLSNLAAGIMLVVFRPFHVGDRIETGGVAGTTREINLFFTEIDMDDNVRVVIPNGKLWGEIVRVPTRNDNARLEILLPRGSDDDVDQTISRVRSALSRHPQVHDVENVDVHEWSDDKYTLAAHVWVPRQEAQRLRLELNRVLKDEFAGKPPASVEPLAG